MSWISELLNIFRPVAPAPPSVDDAEEMLRLTNLHRSQKQLPLYRHNAELDEAAQKHADWMFRHNRLDHVGEGGSEFPDRARRAGYPMNTGGESINFVQGSPADVIEDWMKRPCDRANLLCRGYQDAGFGRAGNFFVAVFGSPM